MCLELYLAPRRTGFEDTAVLLTEYLHASWSPNFYFLAV